MYKLEDIQMQDFGGIGEVIVTKDDTLMMKVLFLLIGLCIQEMQLNFNICLIVIKHSDINVILGGNQGYIEPWLGF